MNFMNWENISDYAFVNTDSLKGEPRGIVMNLHGYTDASTFTKSNPYAAAMGEAGIVFVFPYYSVWAWMSKSSFAYLEEVLDVVYAHYGFDENTPFVVTGGSMGGMTAMMYSLYGNKKARACACNCPVTDLPRIFERGKDMRRAIYSAHNLDERPLSECLEANSPIHNAERLPNIPYYIAFGEKDLGITAEGMEFCKKMKELGRELSFDVVPEMGHCNLMQFPEYAKKYADFVKKNVLG